MKKYDEIVSELRIKKKQLLELEEQINQKQNYSGITNANSSKRSL